MVKVKPTYIVVVLSLPVVIFTYRWCLIPIWGILFFFHLAAIFI